MPTITKITLPKARKNRRNVFLDGRFAFSCSLNVVAKFRLRADLDLTAEKIAEILQGEIKQECLDKALSYLSQRQHSRAEISRKLRQKSWASAVVESVLEDLQRLGYLDDARFAQTKASVLARQRSQGPRRVFQKLMRAGVKGEVAKQALKEAYSQSDWLEMARELAEKHAARMGNLDAATAKRRLTALLIRRGFAPGETREVIEQVLGEMPQEEMPAEEIEDGNDQAQDDR